MIRDIIIPSRLNGAVFCYTKLSARFLFCAPRQSRQLNRNEHLFFGEGMKTITLTKGKVAIVDDEMFDYLSQWKWYCSTQNRAVRTVGHGKEQKMIYMHRVVLGDLAGVEVDHVNMNSLDNRKENLRYCTRAENSANKKKYSTNTSGYKGVSWSKGMKKWVAQITVNYKNTRIGYFDDPEEAAEAYNEVSASHFGLFARGNQVQGG